MDEFRRLIMFLKIQIQNFGTLHRHLSGDSSWFENHEQLDEWGGQLSDQCDDLTEVGMALGYEEPGIKDAVLVFSDKLLDIQHRDCRETFGKKGFGQPLPEKGVSPGRSFPERKRRPVAGERSPSKRSERVLPRFSAPGRPRKPERVPGKKEGPETRHFLRRRRAYLLGEMPVSCMN